MTTMTGVVEQTSKKDVNTKWGLKPTFSFKVNGSWVSHGFKDHRCNVGDEVEFDAESGTYGLSTKAVKVIKAGSGAPPSSGASAAPAARVTSSGGGSRVFPIPPLHGDRSIVRQNALARACELVIACRGGKPFDLDEGLVGLVVGFARQFEAYTAGDLDLAEAKAEAEGE